MNCCRVQSLLSAYLDREVSGSEMLSIRDHLRTCPSCQEEEAGLRAVKLVLCSSECSEPAADFEERLCASIRENFSGPTMSAAKLSGRRSGLAAFINRFRPRPIYAYSLVGLSAFAVVVGFISSLPSSGARGSNHFSFGSMGPVGSGGTALVEVGSKDSKKDQPENKRLKTIAEGKGIWDQMDRDHAFVTSSNPLSGPQVVLSARYAGR